MINPNIAENSNLSFRQGFYYGKVVSCRIYVHPVLADIYFRVRMK